MDYRTPSQRTKKPPTTKKPKRKPVIHSHLPPPLTWDCQYLPQQIAVPKESVLYEHHTSSGEKQVYVSWPIQECQVHLEEAIWPCFNAFLKLEHATDTEICAFVGEWGPLCREERLSPYEFNMDDIEIEDVDAEDEGMEHKELRSWEKVAVYRQTATLFRGLNNLISALHDEELGEREDWEAATRESSDAQRKLDMFWNQKRFDLDPRKVFVARLMSEMMAESDIRPVVTWHVRQAYTALTCWRTYHAYNRFDILHMDNFIPWGWYNLFVMLLVDRMQSPAPLVRCGICQSLIDPTKRTGRKDGKRYCSPKCQEEAHRKTMRERQREKRAREKTNGQSNKH